ncbi:MAG: thioredoxin fold domain-containing protein [Symploca sp. SIO2C1]|nr:thioredoxin fold domain-containing protein [Symploca sp. SIO2C1]
MMMIKKTWLLAFVGFLLFVIGNIVITHEDFAPTFHSSIANLATLKTMARDSVPYQVARTNGKPSLIEFYADWCQTCQSLAVTLEQLQHKYGESINFTMLNIDDPQWHQQIQTYQVTGVPHLTFLRANQEVVETLIGKAPEVVIENILKEFK